MKISMGEFEKFEALFNEYYHNEMAKIAYDHPRGDSTKLNNLKRSLNTFKLGMIGELPKELADLHRMLIS